MVKLIFTKDEKLKAIELYKQTGSKDVTIQMLGYPNNAHTLNEWSRTMCPIGIIIFIY